MELKPVALDNRGWNTLAGYGDVTLTPVGVGSDNQSPVTLESVRIVSAEA